MSELGEDYHTARARLAEERRGRRGGSRRGILVLAVLIGGVVSVGLWLKPPADEMRKNVEAGLSEYAKAKLDAGESAPVVSHSESKDWLLAVSHTAKVGDVTFSCWGGFKVTVCNLPGE